MAAYAEMLNNRVNVSASESEVAAVIDEVEARVENGDFDNGDNPADNLFSTKALDTLAYEKDVTSVDLKEADVSVNEAIKDVFQNDALNNFHAAPTYKLIDSKTLCTVESFFVSGVQYIRTYSDDKTIMNVTHIYGDKIEAETYALNTETGIYEKQVLQVGIENADGRCPSVVYPQGISWGKVHKTQSSFDEKYKLSYQNGKNKKKTYLKIKKKGTFQIRLDNLKNSKRTKCDSYCSYVDWSISHYTNSQLALAGTAASSAIAASLFVANVAFPPSIIVTIIVAAIGGAVGSVWTYVNEREAALNDFRNAYRLFATIKTYGEKVS